MKVQPIRQKADSFPSKSCNYAGQWGLCRYFIYIALSESKFKMIVLFAPVFLDGFYPICVKIDNIFNDYTVKDISSSKRT